MSSKRGRKRNDNLPPNRSRDVQRDFRARRAAHLLALEERASELEEENAKLRKMVGWPPNDRPSLGKGPTGKDKPKLTFVNHGGGGSLPNDILHHGSDSSYSSSPSSLSPADTLGSSQGLHVLDADMWENTCTMDNSKEDPRPEPPYHPSLPAPVSTKLYPSCNAGHASSLPTYLSHSPRSPEPTSAYPTSSASYSRSTERNLGRSYSSPNFIGRSSEICVESPRLHSAYRPPYENRDAHMHSGDLPRPASHSSTQPQPHSPHHREAPNPFDQLFNQVHPLPSQIETPQSAHPMGRLSMREETSGSSGHRSRNQQQEHQQYTFRSIGSYGSNGTTLLYHDGPPNVSSDNICS